MCCCCSGPSGKWLFWVLIWTTSLVTKRYFYLTKNVDMSSDIILEDQHSCRYSKLYETSWFHMWTTNNVTGLFNLDRHFFLGGVGWIFHNIFSLENTRRNDTLRISHFSIQVTKRLNGPNLDIFSFGGVLTFVANECNSEIWHTRKEEFNRPAKFE